jgi:hypothetical protein
MGATRGELRGGAMVDLLVPGSPVGCRGQGSGIDANPNPDRSITCNRTARSRGGAKSWPYRPKGRTSWMPGIASRAGGAGLTGRNRMGALLRFRPEGPALTAWHEMPGQASPEASSPCKGSSQQAPCRVMGGPRGGLRGGAMVDLLVPGSPVGCRGQGSGIDANPNPDRSITCNRTARSRGGAKSWPYRPKGRTSWVPGIASRAGGAGLTGRNRMGALLRFRPEGPALSAWHEMPGQASLRRRRPARAALSKHPAV